MLPSLIGDDLLLMRDRYDEALELLGVDASYQFPNLASSSVQGDPVVDSYSEPIESRIFFEGTPKVKTFKRLGWVVENDKELPFLIHCSWSLPNLQKDSLFSISGRYTGLPDRIFRVTELSYFLDCADHMICQVVPVYGDALPVGRTEAEVEHTFNKSNHFLKPNTDYRGKPISDKPGD